MLQSESYNEPLTYTLTCTSGEPRSFTLNRANTLPPDAVVSVPSVWIETWPCAYEQNGQLKIRVDRRAFAISYEDESEHEVTIVIARKPTRESEK